jgi:PAS domain S-box-containing protein
LQLWRTRLFKSLVPRHIIAVGFAIFFAMIFGSLSTAYFLRKDALQSAQKEISNLAILLAEHALREHESTDAVLNNIATELGDASPKVRIGPTLALHNYLKSHLYNFRYVRSFIINDDKGQLAASTLGYPVAEQYSGDLDFFRVHQNTSSTTLFIDRPVRGRTTGAWLVRESKRISGPVGEFMGVVTAGLDIEYFQDFYASLKFGKGSSVFLMHTDGTVLASFPKKESLLSQPGPQIAIAGKDGDVISSREYGLVAVKRLPKYPVMVAVTMSKSGIYAGWLSHARFLFFGALSAGTAALMLMLLFAKHLRREQALDRSLNRAEQSYQALVDQQLAGVARIDMRTGQYLSVNERLCTMTGYSEKELLRKTLYDLLHPDEHDATRQYLLEASSNITATEFSRNKRYMRKNGSILHAVISSHNITDSLTGITESIGLIQDVTASVELQQRMREHEARLSIIIHNSMDAIITIDGDEKILIFNEAAENLFGYSAQEALSMSLSTLIPHTFRTIHHAHVKAFAQSGETARRMGHNLVLKGLRADGNEFPLEASISRVVSASKVYMTVILRDLTARVKAQAELERARAELRELSIASQTAREEEKSRISRELHDELGQNLTALKMDLSWLQSHNTNETSQRAERLHAMQKVLDSTVVATRRIASDLRPLMLDDLGLLAALEWLSQDFTHRTTVHCNLSLADGVAEVDSRVQSAIYRAVQECLTNISRHAQASQVDIDLQVHLSTVKLEVRDNGIGMQDQARTKSGSFGLIGMRERVYILGGQVTIYSKLGEGTRVAIELPCTPDIREANPTLKQLSRHD